MIVKGKALSIPRGAKSKDSLKAKGMAKAIELFRYMDAKEVNDILRKAFPGVLSTGQFLFLKLTKSNTLKVAEHQTMDGNDIFEIAKGGFLYLTVDTTKPQEEHSQGTPTTEPEHKDVPSDDDLPPAPVPAFQLYTKEAVATLLQKFYKSVKRLQVCIVCYNALYAYI